ncbi:MAG: hypothetical protein WCC45_11975, partial [Paeniglutamicibacter sp.]
EICRQNCSQGIDPAQPVTGWLKASLRFCLCGKVRRQELLDDWACRAALIRLFHIRRAKIRGGFMAFSP